MTRRISEAPAFGLCLAAGQRLVLGQQACADKSNEITAIPLLLDRLAIRGALVTIDAMGCQTNIARKILDKGADYLPAVKENWATLDAEIARVFDDPTTAGLLTPDHGWRSRPDRGPPLCRQP